MEWKEDKGGKRREKSGVKLDREGKREGISENG